MSQGGANTQYVSVGLFRWIIGLFVATAIAACSTGIAAISSLDTRVDELSNTNAAIEQALKALTTSNTRLVAVVEARFDAYDKSSNRFYIDYAEALNWAKRQAEQD